MRSRLGIALLFVAPLAAQAQPPEKPPLELKTTADQASYVLGLDFGFRMKNQGLDVNPEAVLAGLRDVLSGAEPRFSQEQANAIMTAYSTEMRNKRNEKNRAVGEKNQRDGQAFLEANKKKPGVKTTASGLQYVVLKAADGPSPKATDTVRVHYHGTLLNGKVFDSSVERNEPFSFPVGNVIRGWVEAMQLMKVGEKWKLFIPSELAYGAEGAGDDIGPHSVLVFEVELLEIQ